VKTRLIGLAIILAFGAVRLPFESRLEREQKALHYHGTKLDLSLRQRVSQMGFVAALSGFRSVVASFMALQAYTAWQRTEWGKLRVLYETICALQPRNIQSWSMAAWHMHTNASVAAREDRDQPREALRLKAEMEYWQLGEDILLRGIQNNPDRAKLFEELGNLRRDSFKARFNDPEKAYWAYEEAAKRPDAMGYVHRFAVYELAKIPGREREAYDRLKQLYERGESEHLPTLLRLLNELQEKLNIPKEQRIYTPASKNP
jgi:hypothetical protein